MCKNCLLLLLATAVVALVFSAGQVTAPLRDTTTPGHATPKVPAVTLTDAQGRRLPEDWLLGQWTLMLLGYTHCETICRDRLQSLDTALASLAASDPDLRVQGLFVSIDPARDHPAQLRHYCRAYSRALTCARVEPAGLEQLRDALHIIYNRIGYNGADEHYTLDFSLQLLLIAPDGRVAGSVPPPLTAAQIIAATRQANKDHHAPMNADRPPLWAKLNNALFYVLPHHLLSRLGYFVSRIEIPWIKNLLIRGYLGLFDLNMAEAREPNPYAYPSLNALFTRALKPEARPIDPHPDALLSSADGILSEFGDIRAGRLLQAKGLDYAIDALLGGDRTLSEPFHTGQFHTLYLSPRDYHRVHMPLTGDLTDMIYVPGRLFSVSPMTTRSIPNLFTRNERVVAFFDTNHGRMALVLVGAINVAAIETVWAGLITPPPGKQTTRTHYAQPLRLQAGEEMGRFNMGSTVIVVTAQHFAWESRLQPGIKTKVGAALAHWRTTGHTDSKP